MSDPLSYRDAGVDIDAGDALVEAIKPFAKRTLRPEVLAGLGGFGALCAIPAKYKEPILVSGTDGVGTKLKLAFLLNRHGTVGIDLVAMSVNDVLVQGAEPLFFLDYFACGKLDTNVATNVTPCRRTAEATTDAASATRRLAEPASAPPPPRAPTPTSRPPATARRPPTPRGRRARGRRERRNP